MTASPEPSAAARTSASFRTGYRGKSIKRILVPLDPSPDSVAATDTSCRIAQIHGSSVDGVIVLDLQDIESSVIPPIGPYYPQMFTHLHKRIEHAEKMVAATEMRFDEICQHRGIDHSFSNWEGIPSEKLLVH